MADTTERIIFEGVDKISAASKSAEKSVSQLKDVLSSVTSGLAAIGVTVGAGAFVNLHLDALKATAALDDMAESTGASVESLSAIRNVAKVGGQDFEGLTGQIGKMIKGLKEGSDEGGKTASALGFLGVEAKDANGNFRDTGQILIEVSKSLGKYADDGNKVALVQDVLGKGAERYIPLLKDIAQGTDLVTKVTAEQAAKAEEAEKNINRLTVSMSDARRELVNDFTPAIIAYTNKVLAARDASTSWTDAISRLFSVGGDQTKDPVATLDQVNKRLEKLREMQDALSSSSLGARFNRMMAPEDLATVNQQIAFAERQKSVLLELAKRTTFKNMEGMVEDPAGIHLAPALPRSGYQSPAAGGAAGKDKSLKEYFDNLKLLAAIEDREAKDLQAGYDKFGKLEQQKADLLARGAMLRQRLQDEGEQRADEGLERNRARAQASLDAFYGRMLSEEDLEQQRYQKQIDMLDQLALDQFEHDRLVEQMHAEHVERMNRIEDAGIRARTGIAKVHRQLDLDAAKTFFGSMSVLMQSKHRELFEIGKVAAIGETVVNTYRAAVGAYAALSPIPIVGPALGAAAAAAAVLFGMEQVSRIKGTSFGGGGASAAAAPVFAANPSTGLPVGTPGGDVGPRNSITIKIAGDPGDKISVGQLRELMEQFADASEGGARIFVG